MRISVIGAGPGGLSVAGHAGLHGFEVRLHDIREEAVAPIQQQGGVFVRGREEGFAPIALAATDIAAVVQGAYLVVLAVPGPQQGRAALALSPHLEHTRLIVVKPGGTGGALEVAAVLMRGHVSAVVVAETDGFVYGCHIPKPGAVDITTVKNRFRLAAIPAARADDAVATLRQVFPQAQAAPTVLHTSLSNMNAILHVAPMVTNAGRIEHLRGEFEFYGEGITHSVARLVEATDGERMEVARALGVGVPSLREWIRTTYDVSARDLYETIQVLQREVYRHSPAPPTLEHRYLAEDVPCGAVPLASLGHEVGVAVPATTACIELASILVGQDFWATGRTADRLGLAGLSAAEIRARVS